MRYIITGGGTGGHIYPAISIADELKYRDKNAEILFIGTKRGMESKIIPENGYNIEFIEASGINRKNLFKNLKVIKDVFKGTKKSETIIKTFNPDAVIGTGGYVSGAVVRKAYKMGIKTFIQEQNAMPGATNKILSKYVDKIFLGFEESKEHFKDKSKLIVSGNPVREQFFNRDTNEDRDAIGESRNHFVILCFGGSRGAGKINDTICELTQYIEWMSNISIHFVTGKIYYQIIKDKVEKGEIFTKNLKIHEYIKEMPKYVSAADIVISRGGALSVAEITALGKPSILIPSPNVTGNHQYFNAKSLEDNGASIMIEEKNLTAQSLFDKISELKENRNKIKDMGDRAKEISKRNAVKTICDEIEKSLRGK